MRPPHRLDIGYADLLSGFLGALNSRSQDETINLDSGDSAIVAFSVRSALDLYLQALHWDPGGEIIVSAITHPDIVRIIEAHGLIPVSVDVEFATAAPSLAAIERAASAATRAVLIAHLFGAVTPLDGVAALCRSNDWLLIEDAAQVFGAGYAGHPASDAVFISFGPLKTSTALGGCLAVIRDGAIAEHVQTIQSSYPRQHKTAFLKRLATYALLLTVTQPAIYGWVYRGLKWLDRDPTAVMRGVTKGFSGGFDLHRFRQRLCDAQIALLKRRLDRHDRNGIRRRAELGACYGAALSGIDRPGASGSGQTHWIFPVVVDSPGSAIQALAAAGIHAMPGLSNLVAVSNDSNGRAAPDCARHMIEKSLLIPLPPHFDEVEAGRVARALSTAGTQAG